MVVHARAASPIKVMAMVKLCSEMEVRVVRPKRRTNGPKLADFAHEGRVLRVICIARITSSARDCVRQEVEATPVLTPVKLQYQAFETLFMGCAVSPGLVDPCGMDSVMRSAVLFRN